jgi:hypothetical protein
MSATTHASSRGRRPRLSVPTPPRRTRDAASVRSAAAEAPAVRRRLTSLPFLVLVAALLAVGLVTLLMVNNTLAAGSFDQARLRAEQVQLFEQEQALRQDVERLSSPTRLRQQAHTQGLIPAATTAYIDLETGRILGTPVAAGQPLTPGVTATDPATGAAIDPATGAPVDPAAPPATTDPAAAGAATAGDSGAADTTGSTAPGDPATAGDPAAGPTPAPAPDPAAPAPADDGDGAAVTKGGGTAYDRAIVSGGGQ